MWTEQRPCRHYGVPSIPVRLREGLEPHAVTDADPVVQPHYDAGAGNALRSRGWLPDVQAWVVPNEPR